MSITDELRKEARAIQTFTCMAEQAEQLTAIADSIDAEHERICYDYQREHDDWVYIRDTRWVELPKDADGVPWHIGDRTEIGQTVQAMGLNKHGWHFVGTVNDIDPSIHRHYHKPTVEDVLREFLGECEHASMLGYTDMPQDIFDTYATKLRLAGDAE